MTSTSTYHNPGLELNLDHRNLPSSPQTQIIDHKITPSNYQIEDPIYGKVSIDSPCAIEIIHLPEFQRLKKVHQHGITALIGLLPYPLVNRFDHSVGAMLLVRHVGGSEEEQLAALLHDASHTALSHVADSVFGYVVHEVEKVDYLSKTEIPFVLEKYGFDPRRVFNEELFPLLEAPSPQLCADRLDYALRDSVSFGYLNLTDAQTIFKSTIAVNGRMVLNSARAARLLGDGYLKSDQNVWADGCQGYLYKLAAKAIKLSLNQGTIQKKDLWEFGDEDFWNLLKRNATPQVHSIVDRVNSRCYLIKTQDPKIVDELTAAQKNPKEFVEVLFPGPPPTLCCRLNIRVRTIDPLVPVNNNNLVPLSNLDPEYSQIISDYILSRQSPISFIVQYAPLTPESDVSPVALPLAVR